eukprot:TRINITY_DN1083_c0_g1_i8.p1 TRINITY_DN1083_c0_g1~~TRINITY_DN1083_c0_g1_i8.p1  ORF type:complete len:414 (+),score=93.30 TRINITY_DN1083_c0_g1_i8:692-1933(+)
MEAVPSDAELTAAVADILGSENLESLTVRTMMGILGRRFEGVDLTQRKKFIKHEVDRLMHLRVPAPADEGEVGDEGGGYEQQQQHLQVAYPPAGVPATYETNGAPAIEEKKRAKRARPSGKANGGASGGRAAGNPAKPRKLSGLKKAVVLAEPLAHFLGEVVLPRSQIAKRVTTYVKLHNLQDEADKRHILADEALRAVFEVDRFSFFSVNKLISNLVYRPDECSAELQALAEQCDVATLAEEEREAATAAAGTNSDSEAEPAPVEKKPKRKRKAAAPAASAGGPKPATGLAAPKRLDEHLSAVCGGKTVLSRAQVVRALWVYIHAKELQDPQDGRRIICDDALKRVFANEEVVTISSLNKYLSAHLSVPTPDGGCRVGATAGGRSGCRQPRRVWRRRCSGPCVRGYWWLRSC